MQQAGERPARQKIRPMQNKPGHVGRNVAAAVRRQQAPAHQPRQLPSPRPMYAQPSVRCREQQMP